MAPDTATVPTGTWVWIERDHGERTAAVGPYSSVDHAAWALDNATLMQGIVEENCLESWVDGDEQPVDPTHDIYLIDPNDPHHTGTDRETLIARLREYGGEVLNCRNDAEPPYSNEYWCALAALEAADHIEKVMTP